MPEAGEGRRPEEVEAAGDDLAFAAFALSHSPCGDVIEARLGEGSLLQWCLACGEIGIFGFTRA